MHMYISSRNTYIHTDKAWTNRTDTSKTDAVEKSRCSLNDDARLQLNRIFPVATCSEAFITEAKAPKAPGSVAGLFNPIIFCYTGDACELWSRFMGQCPIAKNIRKHTHIHVYERAGLMQEFSRRIFRDRIPRCGRRCMPRHYSQPEMLSNIRKRTFK